MALTAAIAAGAFGLRQLPGVGTLSPMILAALMGIAFNHFFGTSAQARPGIAFSVRRLLRLAIILLGVQVTFQQIMSVGAASAAIVVITLLATFIFTIWLGGILHVERSLAELIAAGTSICGASAIIATNTVTQASDEDVAYALASVTAFGSLAMFVYPLLPEILHLSPRSYGWWAGSSIHEVGQVVAAGYQQGQSAGDYAMIAKLSRVMMLAPIVLSLGMMARMGPGREGAPAARVPLPWFVGGFVALAALNSVISLPPDLKGTITTSATFLLSMALAALGLQADLRRLREKGLRPLLLGGAASLFIAVLSLLLVRTSV